MRKHSPMFEAYKLLARKPEYPDFFFREAINFKLSVAGKTGMVAKIGRYTLSDGIFHTDIITFVSLS